MFLINEMELFTEEKKCLIGKGEESWNVLVRVEVGWCPEVKLQLFFFFNHWACLSIFVNYSLVLNIHLISVKDEFTKRRTLKSIGLLG